MGCYYTLCHNTCACSLLFYKVYIKRENAGSWNSGLEKEQILEIYSAQLQKSWNFTGVIFGINEKYWRKNTPEGPTPWPWGWGHALPPGRAPCLMGPLAGLRCPSSAIWSLSSEKKNHKQAFGKKLRHHEAEPWRNQSRAPAELFCRGHFPPGGENRSHRHHQLSSHRGRANLHRRHLISNPSSSLEFNFCLKTRDWYMWVASSVDYIS